MNAQTVDVTKLYDAVIVGGGPAGLTAALYLARARYRVLVVEKEQFGGQITITDEVVNYPGVLSISGSELGETMRRQAEGFGAEFLLAEVTSLDMAGEIKRVATTKGDVLCHAVMLATGASPRQVGFAGEEEFRGHGVAYCATCDGEFFTGKEVFVVGGGFAAAEEAIFLTKYASHVTIMVRRDAFRCAPSVVEEVMANDKIDVLYNTEIIEVEGGAALERMRYKNSATGEEFNYAPADGGTFGIFVFVGYAPATGLVADEAELNPAGYIITNDANETNVDGLFAAGDVCVKELRQVATAVGQAAAAATNMERYCKAAQERTGLVPPPPTAQPASKQATEASEQAPAKSSEGGLFTPDMLAQLDAVFGRMASSLVLRVAQDTSSTSDELVGYMNELAGLTEKLSVELVGPNDALPSGVDAERPFVQICNAAGEPTGLEFHGVPGGHEFTGFVLGLYNAAGPGQPIAEADKAAVEAIDTETNIKVLVTLSCTMCPEVVQATQRMASLNSKIHTAVYDSNVFTDLAKSYNVMSVPCLVVEQNGEEKVSFGKKNMSQILDFMNS